MTSPSSDLRTSAERSARLAALSIVIASFSFFAAAYQAYIHSRTLDIVQRDLARAEMIRACKEVIDAFFEVRHRVGVVTMRAGPAGGEARALDQAALDAAHAVNRFAALGTFLANFGDEPIRVRYTELSRELDRVVGAARESRPAEMQGLLETADRMFAAMNEDCVRSTRVPEE